MVPLRRLYGPLVGVTALMFAIAPILVVQASYEPTMGLVQKIFYFHVPSGILALLSPFVCGIASLRYLMWRDERADGVALSAAELAVLFGAITLITGPLWARKSWGVWWIWDARITTAFLTWMIFVSYLLLRRYGGPGSERLAAGLGIFGMANVPFVYKSVDIWRTIHPQTSVVPTLPSGMRSEFWFCLTAFALLYVVLLLSRVGLERQRTRLEALYLELEG